MHTQTGLKNIEDVQIGDVVLSWNEKTGTREYKEVTNLWVRQTTLLYEVKLPGQDAIITTWNHPFWSVTQSAWIAAKDLKEGEILSLEDGSETFIESITHYETEETTVYNFEVEGNHTYYVSEAGVLVHNETKRYTNSGAGSSSSWGSPLPEEKQKSASGEWEDETFADKAKRLNEELKTYLGSVIINNLDSFAEFRDKKETDVDGKPQKTGTNGHAETIAEKTLELRDSGEYDKIYLNKGINRVLGEPKLISPNRRPDIVAVRKDGRIDLFEIASETDKEEDLKERMREVRDKLPEEKKGAMIYLEIDQKKYPRNKKK
ncbi:MAG: hypothetical protein JJT78_16230 [Leptospira sp.]|nr:hypothetical protein [Leptospira sp.]